MFSSRELNDNMGDKKLGVSDWLFSIFLSSVSQKEIVVFSRGHDLIWNREFSEK